jgi:wyosine [tRNA(Phe)-imidazoG37] synthetase (radical SAM superfamily)
MLNETSALTFGPVPSRRLGRSLGINNIPPKTCTYSCAYCQLGITTKIRAARETFHNPEDLLSAVRQRVREAGRMREQIDFLTFVADGEPTLDINLGKEIELLKPLGVKIGVISNASLIWRPDVQDDLLQADWVSVKIDSVTEATWRKLNRPHRSLDLDRILAGIAEFSGRTEGELVTETMLVRGVNDATAEMQRVGDFIAGVEADTSYISVPTRPPAVRWAGPPAESAVTAAYQIFSDKSLDAECLIGYEGDAFAATGDVESDLLSITAVHPMREDAVSEFLASGGTDWSMIEKLVAEGKMVETEYGNRRFYVRKLPGN